MNQVGTLFDVDAYTEKKPSPCKYYGPPPDEDLPPNFWEEISREEPPLEHFLEFPDYVHCTKCNIGLSSDEAASGVCPICDSWVYPPVPAPDQSPLGINGENGGLKFPKPRSSPDKLPQHLRQSAYCETCNVLWREDELELQQVCPESEPICPGCSGYLIFP